MALFLAWSPLLQQHVGADELFDLEVDVMVTENLANKLMDALDELEEAEPCPHPCIHGYDDSHSGEHYPVCCRCGEEVS